MPLQRAVWVNSLPLGHEGAFSACHRPSKRVHTPGAAKHPCPFHLLLQNSCRPKRLPALVASALSMHTW